jgi:hypothetical protein
MCSFVDQKYAKTHLRASANACKNFPGGYTFGPPRRDGATPSLHPPQLGLRPRAVARSARGSVVPVCPN